MREEAEGTTIELIKETISKIKQALNEEKRERADNEETLIAILEKTCLKLNNITHL